MKRVMRISPVIAAILILVAMLSYSVTAFASEAGVTPDNEEVTNATVPAPTVPIKNLQLIGSNGKTYLCSPSLADGTDKYSFNIPNWMEDATIRIKGEKGLNISNSGSAFTEESGVYDFAQSDITKDSQTYTVTIAKDSVTRTLELTVKRTNIPCKIESVALRNNGKDVTGTGSIADGLTYTLEAGTVNNISLRIMPRHENTVTITNLTGIADENITGDEPEDKLTLSETSKRYDYTLKLVEGTNRFRLDVAAGGATKTCMITVVVGDPNANAPTTTTVSTTASATDTPATVASLNTTTTRPNEDGSGLSKLSPIVLILLGVIATVIVGAIIFMIVNMSSRRNSYDDYDDYDDYPPAPRRGGYDDYDDYDDRYDDRGGYPSGRNLTDYMDDDYDDRNSYSRRSGYDSDYDDYSDRDRRRYDNDYDSRRDSRRGGGYYDDNDYRSRRGR